MRIRQTGILMLAGILLAGCGPAAGSESALPESSMSEISADSSTEKVSKTESVIKTETAEETHSDEIPKATAEVFAMDTYMTITCYGENAQAAADAATEEIKRLDEILSVGNPESEISRINENKEGIVTEDTAEILKKALEISEETEGAFDITVYPLMEAWGFTSGEFRVPEEAEITELLAAVGSGRIAYDAETGNVVLAENQGIDLGGIAKGYTSDRIMEIFAEYDLVSGVVSLGGNVECCGTKPDGSLWRCGIQSPLESSELMGVLEMSDGAAITSGAYERYFTDEASGKTYHHILDPATGYSAETGLLSVTIVTPNGLLADGLSTACFVMGLDEAAAFWRNYDEPFDFIIMTEDEEIYITEGIAERFTSSDPVTVLKKEGDGNL